jgi:Glutamine synthetase adenylyltransferase
VFISWLAGGADPDMGLLNFRILSEDIGDSHWYLALLRDSGVAAHRLMIMLPNSRWIAEALAKRPEAVAWLDDDDELAPREPYRLAREVAALIDRHDDAVEAAARVRAVRTRELTRCAMSDLLGGVNPRGNSIADATDAAILGALAIAQREETERWGGIRANVVFVAMGRYGGRECSYASDADAIALHEAVGGASDVEAVASATAIVNRVKKLLGSATNQLGVVVDLDLRPEGKNGPMSRTIESHREYAQRWASTWERQAAVRARPIGEGCLADQARELFAELAYGGVSESDVRDIRLLKARMENERLPRGIEPARHVKLGPGGLTDVEWTIQLIQMRGGLNNPALRTPSTVQAIQSARENELVSAQDAETLLDAWDMATRIRAANTLASGRMSGVKLDVLPRDSAELRALAAILGYGSGGLNALEDDWLRAGRKARAVMERLFWEQQ